MKRIRVFIKNPLFWLISDFFVKTMRVFVEKLLFSENNQSFY